MTTTPTEPLARTVATDANLERLAAAGRLYAILDATDAPAVPALVQTLGESRAVSLYRGSADEQLWAVAPYLVRVAPELLDWIATVLGGDPGWGILVVSDRDLTALRKHFRRFLMARLPEGSRVYFRFYDPRVLGKIIDRSTEAELEQLFGPVRSFGIPHPERPTVLVRRTRAGATEAAVPAGDSFFQLRPEHLQAFDAEGEQALVGRIAAHLRDEYPEAVADLPDVFLEDRIRLGLARARSYGFRWESDLAVFVAFMFAFAPDFDDHPDVVAILTDEDLPLDGRVRVLAHLGDEVWDEIVARRTDDAWSHLSTEP